MGGMAPYRRSREYAIGLGAVFLVGVGMAGWNWLKLERLPGADLDERELLQLLLYAGCFLAGAGAVAFWCVVPTMALKEGLASLKPIEGKTKDAVSAALGRPGEVEYADGVTRATWSAPRFRVTLAFRDGVCTGVVRRSET